MLKSDKRVHFHTSGVLIYDGEKGANSDRRPIKSDLECGRSDTGNADEIRCIGMPCPSARHSAVLSRRDGRDLARRTQSRAESDGERFVRLKTMYQLDRGPPD